MHNRTILRTEIPVKLSMQETKTGNLAQLCLRCPNVCWRPGDRPLPKDRATNSGAD